MFETQCRDCSTFDSCHMIPGIDFFKTVSAAQISYRLQNQFCITTTKFIPAMLPMALNNTLARNIRLLLTSGTARLYSVKHTLKKVFERFFDFWNTFSDDEWVKKGIEK